MRGIIGVKNLVLAKQLLEKKPIAHVGRCDQCGHDHAYKDDGLHEFLCKDCKEEMDHDYMKDVLLKFFHQDEKNET